MSKKGEGLLESNNKESNDTFPKGIVNQEKFRLYIDGVTDSLSTDKQKQSLFDDLEEGEKYESFMKEHGRFLDISPYDSIIPKHEVVIQQEEAQKISLEEEISNRNDIKQKEKYKKKTFQTRMSLLNMAIKEQHPDVWSFVPSKEDLPTDYILNNIVHIITKQEDDHGVVLKFYGSEFLVISGTTLPIEFIEGWTTTFNNINKDLMIYNGHTFYNLTEKLRQMLDDRDLQEETITNEEHKYMTFVAQENNLKTPWDTSNSILNTNHNANLDKKNSRTVESAIKALFEKKDTQQIEYDHINPSHYGNTPGVDNPYEVINIIEHFDLDRYDANVLKYMLRSGKKPGNSAIQELKKQIWYLNRKLTWLEKKEKV